MVWSAMATISVGCCWYVSYPTKKSVSSTLRVNVRSTCRPIDVVWCWSNRDLPSRTHRQTNIQHTNSLTIMMRLKLLLMVMLMLMMIVWFAHHSFCTFMFFYFIWYCAISVQCTNICGIVTKQNAVM